MADRIKQIRHRGRRSHNWQEIFRCGPQSGPRFPKQQLAQIGDHPESATGDFAESRERDAFVKSSLFHRRAGEDSSVAARHQITSKRKNRRAKLSGTRLETDDLPAHWVARKAVTNTLNFARPCTR